MRDKAQETEFIRAMNDRWDVRCGMATLLRWLSYCKGDEALAEMRLRDIGALTAKL